MGPCRWPSFNRELNSHCVCSDKVIGSFAWRKSRVMAFYREGPML